MKVKKTYQIIILFEINNLIEIVFHQIILQVVDRNYLQPACPV